MFRLADAREIAAARAVLAQRLATDAQRVQRNDRSLRYWWRPELGLSVWFRDDPGRALTGQEVWRFYFGTDLASGTIMEINFPTELKDKSHVGRIVVDESGSLYLAHKGELRGGILYLCSILND